MPLGAFRLKVEPQAGLNLRISRRLALSAEARSQTAATIGPNDSATDFGG